MAALKVGDKVKVKDGEEHAAAVAGVLGTVKTVDGTTIGVVFDGADKTSHTYQADQLQKQ